MNINIIKQKIKDVILKVIRQIAELLKSRIKVGKSGVSIASPSTGDKVMTKTSKTSNNRHFKYDCFSDPQEPNYINSQFVGSKKNKRKGKSRKKVTQELTLNKKIKRV